MRALVDDQTSNDGVTAARPLEGANELLPSTIRRRAHCEYRDATTSFVVTATVDMVSASGIFFFKSFSLVARYRI